MAATRGVNMRLVRAGAPRAYRAFACANILQLKLRRLEHRSDGDGGHWQSEAGTWEETEETESCDDGGDDQQAEATWRSEMDEWEEELEANIELERRELGQSPPEDHEDWADD